MRRFPIRVKLAAALAVPLIAVGLVTLVEVISVDAEARDVRDQTELATATIGPEGLLTALQNERNWMSAHLVGVEQRLDMAVVGYDETRAATDAAIAQFERELDGPARTAYAPALEGLAALTELRAEIDTRATTTERVLANIGPVTELFDRYTELIEPFFGGMSRISIAMDDPELRQGAKLMETVTRQLETVPQLTNALVLPASVPTGAGDAAGINRAPEIAELAELHDTFVRQAAALRSASGPFAEIAAELYPVEFTQALDEQSAQALATGSINIDTLLGSLQSPDAGLAYVTYRDAVADALQDRADELNAEATGRRRQFGLLMTATFASAVALTVVVSLSITRPLRSLTQQAKEMAERRLPDAVADILDTPLGEDVIVPTVAALKVNTRDEVADVADALNKVQDSALDLAVEQAVLRRNLADSFVNLGRRNQNLLGRQLDFITELETNETEPDTLASLFRLDHLATRMRRNAESLLVLAGIEPPRQWAAPVRVTDVIRAALGEVENYDRVTVRGVEPATVQGSVAADLAHLLAELVENALAFSPPDRSVDIHGSARSARLPGGYTLAVVDAGMGMPPDDLAAANRRLAGVESFTVAPSKYLGHYVAGNLAARHGIGVHLDSAPGAGVTATVELPPDLLTTGPDPLPAPGAPSVQAAAPRDRQPFGAPSPSPQPAVAPWPGSATPSLTAGGLARRDPRGAAVASAGPNRPPTAPTDAQLASLARIAGRDDAPRRPAAPAQPTGPVPATHWPTGPSSGPSRGGPEPATPAWPSSPPAPRTPPPAGPPSPGAPGPLTRRRPGAQMPTTAPVSLRRTPRDDADPGRPASPPAPVRRQPVQAPPVQLPSFQPPPGVPSSATPASATPSQAADEVYGFLSSFTAGVQRGLEATRGGTGDEPRR